jgi:hypothetical protein
VIVEQARLEGLGEVLAVLSESAPGDSDVDDFRTSLYERRCA